MAHRDTADAIGRIVKICFVAVLLVIALFPLAWLILTSFKGSSEILSVPPTVFPQAFTVEAYYDIWWKQPFAVYIFNTIKVTLCSTALSIFCAALAGYGFANLKFPLKKLLLMIVLIAQMFPASSLIISIFEMYHSLGLYDTHVGLILMYSTITLSFAIWMLYGYFKNIPVSLKEAAIIDGATEFQVFSRVVLPLAKPGIAAVGVYSFMTGWNEYFYALILTTTNNKLLASVGLANFITEFGTKWNEMSAASVIVVIPTLIIFMLLGKNLIAGLTAGAVKG